MKIIHRIAFHTPRVSTRLIDQLEIKYKQSEPFHGSSMVSFDISESDKRWPDVKLFALKNKIHTGVCWTTFTKRELETATWLEIGSTSHIGYPKPDDDNGYLEATYDLADYCPTCGIGLKQVRPFRIRGEPKWGTREIMQLNWVFEEYFVPPAIWETVFKPFGIDCQPVVHHKTGNELQGVVQLKNDFILDQERDLGDHKYEICDQCDRKKYLPFVRGMLPETEATIEKHQMFKTKEYYGSGASADRCVIVSQCLRQKLLEQRVRGINFSPLAKHAPQENA